MLSRVTARLIGVAVELGRTWGAWHGDLRIARVLLGSDGRAATLNRDVRAQRQAPPQADKLRRRLTPPAGGWLRRQRRRETARRQASRRRVELTPRENLRFQNWRPRWLGGWSACQIRSTSRNRVSPSSKTHSKRLCFLLKNK